MPSTLNENTNVPIKVIVPIITAIVIVTMWINSTLNRIESSIHDTWRIRDMQKWSTILRNDNPALKVASPYDALSFDRNVTLRPMQATIQ